MTAISKAWVTIGDSQVDPDSPLDATLMTGIRDDLVHLREWLGNGFTGGAVQDHNHDGSNSALVPIGPNALRNGSFEDGESGWTFTDYSGGSHAISTSAHRHGAKSAQFTSTVLANGGGDALTNEYMTVSEADLIALKFWIWASVANVSSKLEVTWYDNAKASISTTTVQSYTNTPTTQTFHRLSATAPTNARFFKIRVTGGVPASGSATGTITFDGIEVGSSALVVSQSNVFSGVIGQAQLKTTTGEVTTNSTTGINTALAGGEYGFYPTTRRTGGSAWMSAQIALQLASTSYSSNIFIVVDNAGETARATQRYVQASPPYDLGDGGVPLFVFALVDSLGNVRATYAAEDPPWANNGPTKVRADLYDARGRAFKWVRPAIDVAALRDPATRAAEIAKLSVAPQLVEITQAIKQADMPLIPHPFTANDLTGLTVVMLDPMAQITDRLQRLLAQGEAVGLLLHDDYLRIGNTALVRAAPPGVMPVSVNWKLT